jgi:hypothetical protein
MTEDNTETLLSFSPLQFLTNTTYQNHSENYEYYTDCLFPMYIYTNTHIHVYIKG